ncbi:hypothetical protein [Paenibacillus jilunlii]|uniref:Uncharacterized protein n=1 Tax=Paenibacillus jilunlii TaxID=682956 RepID=A0A1H0A296_9BACL|nr:hypothetical protein [Paenibacillus jilunlii]KWX79950.1 hypothetical protein AML91_01920 [Paenibacillus jilunlii]SDN27839.1 hypothetical protein SAMN05216191_13444 [Paenibacillus jilunlii]
MKLWEQFLDLKSQIHNIYADEDKRLADARFLRSVESIERTLKRSLRGSEYRVLFTFDDHQAELIKNLLKEARNGEERST